MEKEDFEQKLLGKRILFFAVQTFDYENKIAEELRHHGAVVDYYDERPANTILAKGIIRVKKSLYQSRIDHYYLTILKRIQANQYDYLFLLRGEVMPEFFLMQFKQTNPQCYLIFYTWDSFNNNPHAIKLVKHFNQCYTFDSDDSKKYKINFQPLFFTNEYNQVNRYKSTAYRYDLLFIGTAHSDRYEICQKIEKWCKANNLKMYSYFRMPSRLVFFYKRLLDKSFKRINYHRISFRNLNTGDIIELYKQSAVILDINHPGQTGLTMRTMEALGAGKKLITTNEAIKNYAFYNENNVLVIDRNHPILNKEFFKSPFMKIPVEIRNSMSITGWVKTLFRIGC